MFLAQRRYREQLSVDPIRRRNRDGLRAVETTLWLAVVGILGYSSFVYASATVHQAQPVDLSNFSDESFLSRPALGLAPPFQALQNAAQATNEGKLLGFLDIPSIGLSSVVEEGTGPRILLRSVGHVPGTALPGQNGNVGLAGHLDAYLAELSKLRVGDILTFRSMNQTFDYEVVGASRDGSRPENNSSSTTQSTLTLIDYSPLQKIGKTKNQLVITAREMAESRSTQ